MQVDYKILKCGSGIMEYSEVMFSFWLGIF